MLAQDIKPNRLERAKLAIEDLLQQLRGDRLGLVPFAGSAFIQCPLTLDYGAFAENLRAVEVGIIPKGGTSLAAAIRTGIEAFEGRSGEDAILVIITDGEDHEGQVEAAAQQARDRGIRIYPVGIGTPEGELIVVSEDGQSTFVKDRQGRIVKSRLEARSLQDIAITTRRGLYLRRRPESGSGRGVPPLYRSSRRPNPDQQRGAAFPPALPVAAASAPCCCWDSKPYCPRSDRRRPGAAGLPQENEVYTTRHVRKAPGLRTTLRLVTCVGRGAR